MTGPLEGGDVWGPGRVPHGASPPSSGPTTSHPAGPLEPEASYQAQAEEDAVRRELQRATSAGYSIEGLLHDRFRLGAALAVAERERDEWKATAETWEDGTGTQLLIAERDEALRERDQAREALRQIAAIQPRALAIIERHGFVFDSIGAEPGNWQHLAFTIYTELCEAETIARAALGER